MVFIGDPLVIVLGDLNASSVHHQKAAFVNANDTPQPCQKP
ncbi:hypothetical Protein YC6258_03521 [Gynuella sunshinyii YC6258]|uniref:Uncharacterized protein n=1 Tax=Gynuella sunshinyii YC6258 TaxID=1445510 RepID=A0A0C5VML4_9GAMM|nr:hypothetical Protein YC6258_03521 [Gynuella sunshinyii YC6258]